MKPISCLPRFPPSSSCGGGFVFYIAVLRSPSFYSCAFLPLFIMIILKEQEEEEDVFDDGTVATICT